MGDAKGGRKVSAQLKLPPLHLPLGEDNLYNTNRRLAKVVDYVNKLSAWERGDSLVAPLPEGTGGVIPGAALPNDATVNGVPIVNFSGGILFPGYVYEITSGGLMQKATTAAGAQRHFRFCVWENVANGEKFIPHLAQTFYLFASASASPTVGSRLWLHTTEAGTCTATYPGSGNVSIFLGYAITTKDGSGRLTAGFSSVGSSSL